jgi:hypothetical protein
VPPLIAAKNRQNKHTIRTCLIPSFQWTSMSYYSVLPAVVSNFSFRQNIRTNALKIQTCFINVDTKDGTLPTIRNKQACYTYFKCLSSTQETAKQRPWRNFQPCRRIPFIPEVPSTTVNKTRDTILQKMLTFCVNELKQSFPCQTKLCI